MPNRGRPKIHVSRLFEEAEPPRSGERFDILLSCRNLSIRRILSAPHTRSGPYNQESDEWALVLRGNAVLDLDGQAIALAAGEAVFIPAGTPHSVVETSEDPPCLWLAIHLDP